MLKNLKVKKVKNIRGIGDRADSYLDSIDLEILETLEKYEGLGVLALAEDLKIKHQTLKKHLEKLNAVDLILIATGKKPNQLMICHPVEFYSNMALDSPEAEEKQEQIIYVKNVQKVLREIRGLDWTNKISKRLALSLSKEDSKK